MTRKIVNTSALIINIGVAFCLLISYLASFISPEDLWPIAFFGLAYPILLIANVLFLIYWLFQLKKWVFISLISIIVGFNYITSYIQFFPKINTEKNKHKLNIMSFNTHYMGAFERENNDTNMFFEELKSLNPDIICFQEFANLGGIYENPLFKRFFKVYKDFYNVNANGKDSSYQTGYGVCLFSRYPIINKGFIERINHNSNLTVFADIVVDGDTIRVVSTHLKSIVFEKEDFETMREIKNGKENMDIGQVRHIGSKLKYAFKARALQADLIKENLSSCAFKLVICGDFNDAPTSYSYRTLRGNLKDAFKESGIGMSRTYIGKMPSFRIDYILHDPSITSFNYRTHTLNISDHKMISCALQLN